MRAYLLFIAFATALPAAAQQPAVTPLQPPAGSSWQHVQALPLGTAIQVKTRASHTNCALKSVDADSLTCIHGKDLVFQRSEIQSITIPHRGRSIGVGAAIGVGAGAGIGAGLASRDHGWFSGAGWDALAAGVFGVIGAATGTVTGAVTDFTHSTIYKAP